MTRPKPEVEKNLRNLQAEIRHQRHAVNNTPTIRNFPEKKLRNSLQEALCLPVISQSVEKMEPKKVRDNLDVQRRLRKSRDVTLNPVWQVAPQGAFYKSRRVSTLITDVVRYGGFANVTKDLLRLSIHIWNMPKRHFDGLLRRIRVRLYKTAYAVISQRKPESLVRIGALTNNPRRQPREYGCNRHPKCRHIDGYAAMQLSTKVDLVLETRRCTKCTIRRVSKMLFTQHGVTA